MTPARRCCAATCRRRRASGHGWPPTAASAARAEQVLLGDRALDVRDAMLLCEVAAELEDGARSRVDARPLRPDGARPVRRASGVVAVVDDDVLVRLVRRRLGWHRGLLDTLWSHRDAILRPRYRGMAFGGLGLFTAVEAVGPIIDALGLVALVAGLSLGLVHHEFALLAGGGCAGASAPGER